MSAANTGGGAFVPDYEDDPVDFLVSFPDIKARTTQALYASRASNENPSTKASSAASSSARSPWAVDKSPKGSVDEPIQPLVDLINHHPSFSTLSSCSGRIALFQPWEPTSSSSSLLPTNEVPITQVNDADSFLREAGDNQEEPSEQKNSKSTPGSGKGRGGWLLVSHEKIEYSELLSIFDKHVESGDSQTEPRAVDTSTSILESNTNELKMETLMFKVEPMLLHVAVATVDRGRQLLGLALALGFRESGLVLPSKNNNRVTVAIRGMSLALTVPLAFDGPLCPSREYLRALVDQANHRMELNQSKLQRLYHSVRESLFRTAPINSDNLGLYCQILPSLNIWGHAAVVLPCATPNTSSTDDESTGQSKDATILVFGGYGEGPDTPGSSTENNSKQCRRLGEVYSLQRRSGRWRDCWERIQQPIDISGLNDNVLRLKSIGVDVRVAQFTPREGVSAFAFDDCIPKLAIGKEGMGGIVGIWGGRKGPNAPLNEFLLFQHSNLDDGGGDSNNSGFYMPLDIRGEIPSARWGHSLTSLRNKIGDNSCVQRLAVLVGGRNERELSNSAHLLSLVDADSPSDSGHFLWETIHFPSNLHQPILPFHHASIIIPSEDEEGHDNGRATIFVFGGISNPANLLEAFGPPEPLVTSFTLDFESSHPYQAEVCSLQIPDDTAFDFGVGGAFTVLDCLTTPLMPAPEHRYLLLKSGGTPTNVPTHLQDGQSSYSCLQLLELSRHRRDDRDNIQWVLQPSSDAMAVIAIEGNPERSVMVHHQAVFVPSSPGCQSEVVLLGGGVMGFAFGPCFSK